MDLDRFMDDDASKTNTARGIISGFLGGLTGTLVKAAVEEFLEVREIDEKAVQLKVIDDLSERITGSPMKIENEELAEHFVDIPLGASIGAAYGYGKKDSEEINLFDGMILGATTWASTHETSLPLAGLEKNPEDTPITTQLQELFAHVLYGVTTEVVRGFLNRHMKKL